MNTRARISAAIYDVDHDRRDPVDVIMEIVTEERARTLEAAAADHTAPAESWAFITPEGREWLRGLAALARQGRW